MMSNKGINRFYTTLPRMQREYRKLSRQQGMRAKSLKEFLGWREKTTTDLIKVIGLDRMEMCNTNPIVEEKVQLEGGIIREKVIIQTELDVRMPMYILIPETCRNNKKAQVYIAPNGHCGGGRFSVAGCRENPLVSAAIDKYNYDYGMQLAKKGVVAICPDSRGFGERRECPATDDKDSLNGNCIQLAHMAEPLGMTVAGMNTWDLIRLMDYIEERDEWDSDNINCLGFSGGGMQTLWLAALDERVKKAVISGYMYGFRDSHLLLCNNCSCNYVPHLWELVDMGDIASLIAPRPLVIQSCLDDHLNGLRGIANVTEQVDIVRRAYALFDAEDHLIFDTFPGEHRWHDEHLEQYLSL